ncbi:MAG: hypothetical protein GX091_04915 [Peptococcaceae bacterium]|nr:hypothetical protein [Peptococcaceae bacterium]
MNYSEFYLNEAAHTADLEVKSIGYGCEICILPVNYAFGNYKMHNGKRVCKFCRNFEKPHYWGEEEFIKDINLQKGEKIGVTVSGGKDSLYAWFKLVAFFGPENVIAFNHLKCGLVHPVAMLNLERAKRILKTELIVIRDEGMLPRFKKNLEALLNHPSPEMVRVALCTGCRYGISEAIYNVGNEMGIKKYVSAASNLELAPFKEELLADKGNGDDTRGLLKGLEENKGYEFDDNINIIWRDHKYKYKGNLSSDDKKVTDFKGYQLFDLDKYIPNNPQSIEQFVIKNLDWIRPERSWHYDCIVEEMKDVFYYGLLGYTEADFKLSAMVRHKLITRKDAMHQIEIVRTIIRNSYPQTEKFLRNMGLEHLIEPMREFYTRSPYLKTPADSIYASA